LTRCRIFRSRVRSTTGSINFWANGRRRWHVVPDPGNLGSNRRNGESLVYRRPLDRCREQKRGHESAHDECPNAWLRPRAEEIRGDMDWFFHALAIPFVQRMILAGQVEPLNALPNCPSHRANPAFHHQNVGAGIFI
jgi:hypothetical protein